MPPASSSELSRGRMEAPRLGSGSARSLLLTLVGEFALAAPGPIWTRSFLAVLGGLGVTEKAGRQAIARAARAGWIEGQGEGRRMAWRIGPEGRRLVSEGSRRVRSLGQEVVWDGRWLVLHVTLPQTHRTERLRLYRALSWIGFGSPIPALWICPHVERAAETERLIGQMGLSEHALAFLATALPFGIAGERMVSSAWDLAGIAAHYAALLERFSNVEPADGDELLRSYVELVNALQRLPSVDPGLPETLMPFGLQIRSQARSLGALRDRWRARAHGRWQELARP